MAALRCVELVGPPGAGKSTVFASLLRAGATEMPLLRRRPHLPLLLRHVTLTAAAVARRRAFDRRWDREMLVMAAYLRALPTALDGPRRPTGDVLVFDQGPVYTLTRPALRDPRMRDWAEASLRLWRSRLDVVGWLDAPDMVLAERIDGRDKAHRYKHAGAPAVAAALAEDRSTYAEALARMEAPGGPAVLRFDTSEQPPEAVAAAVLAAAGAR